MVVVFTFIYAISSNHLNIIRSIADQDEV